MMKLGSILLLTQLMSSITDANSADKPSVYGEIKENKKKAEDGSDETLRKLLTVKGVDVQYKACQTAFPNQLAEIPKCIWEGNGNSPPRLADDIRKQVQLMYAQESTEETSARSPASESSHLTNKSKQISEDYMSDPAVVELSKIMQKKLEEALLGDEEAQKDKKTIAVVDHAKYIELYRTELGKTIVNAFTSYCVEADIETSLKLSVRTCKNQDNPTAACPLFILSDDNSKAQTIKKNIQSLRGADLSSNTADATNPTSELWKKCILSVSNVCYTPKNDFAGANIDNQIIRSKTRACTIMDYVKSARKNLMVADEQKKYYDTLEPTVAMQMANARQVVINEKNSMDAVTTVTSKDIEDSYQTKNDALKKEMDKCIDAKGDIADPEICKKFISTDTEAKEKALTEFGIRQYALEAKIEEKFNDKGEIEKYLKEEGYAKEKIAQMISDDLDLATVKKEIIDRYKSEREAIIASMAEKIQSKTTKDNGKIDTSATGSDQEKLVKIRKELSSRSDDLKQLVHFNNVVSSYLEIDKGNGQKSRNVASLFAEIHNGAKEFRDIDKEQIKDINDQASKAGLKQEKGENQIELTVKDLNGIFKYSTEK